ncbi:hypothetical protein [Maribacter aestuarii]|nr:hypothetical protein [Maribacter aestuarii]
MRCTHSSKAGPDYLVYSNHSTAYAGREITPKMNESQQRPYK